MVRDKRVVVMVGVTVVLALSFWMGSRYPDLELKAQASSSMILDGLGFDVVFPVEGDDPLWLKVGKRTVNWLETNKKGMLFGLMIAAAMASTITLFCRRRLSTSFGNTLLGVAIGAPLGLCVNCAAPVATGLHNSGSRTETSLAATLASPTLNVLVLSILFTMLPLHLALLKVVFTLVLLLVGVPILAKWAQSEPEPGDSSDGLCAVTPPPSSWWTAVTWAAKQLLANFWQLLLRLGPLMVLAGALGSFVISVLPFEELGSVTAPSLLGLGLVAAVGTFLPVPIAFDVVICALLYEAGMPVAYVMVLLFTLGSFSVFTFEVFRQTVLPRLAWGLFLGVWALGVLSAYCAAWVDGAYKGHVDKKLLTELAARMESHPLPPRPQAQPPLDAARLSAELQRQQLNWETVATASEQLKLERRPFTARSPGGATLFAREEASTLGLELPIVLSFSDQWTIPARSNRAVASGDIHGDGWTDLVVANDYEVGGVTLFANLGGKFVRQSLDLGELNHHFVTVAALVDVNNDGWLDLFLATLQGENRLLLNQQGEFGEMRELPTLPGACVTAAGFADLDGDHDLDIVLGTWVHFYARTEYPRLWNYKLLQEGPLEFSASALPGFGGNTHCVLISDLDNDGRLDLALGNDWSPADQFFKGLGKGEFEALGGDVVPRSTEWTMSMDSADLDNDLELETFINHIAFERETRKRRADALEQSLPDLLHPAEVETIKLGRANDLLHRKLRFSQDPADCAQRAREEDGRDCLYDVLLSRVWRKDKRELWEPLIPSHDVHLKTVFDRLFPVPRAWPEHPPGPDQFFPSSKEKNVVLRSQGERFEDVVDRWNLGYTYWGWNAKFADLDEDGFQDLYLVNGSFQQQLLTSNLLFLNQQGKSMKRVDDEGAADYFPTSNYTYIDLDNDGDLDILTAPPNGQLRLYRNQQSQHHAIKFQLEDRTGLRSGVGAKVTLRWQGGQQVRELKASGGFGSFDAPELHFGLSRYARVEEVEVRWPDGARSVVSGLDADHLYRLTKLGAGEQ